MDFSCGMQALDVHSGRREFVRMESQYPSKRAPGVASTASGRGKVKILVAAPASACEDLRRVLVHSCWSLTEVSCIAEAEPFLEQGTEGVVICEARLPDGTWQDLLERVRRRPVVPPLIVTDRQADDRLWLEVLDGGGYNVLARPFDATDVFRVVGNAWRHRSARAAAA
jgi:DNA-binding NtrC family response regulator